MKSVLLLFVLLFVQGVSAAKPPVSCGADTVENLQYKFCYNQVDRSQNSQDIIFFLHGLQGSERSFFTDRDYQFLLQSWERREYRPTVITVSLGPEWLLIERDKKPLISLFARKLFPKLESRVGGLKEGRRLLIGSSMGGFNAAQLALRYPQDFNKVALLCPAITALGPYAKDQEIRDYIHRTKARGDYVMMLLEFSRQKIADKEEWDRHNSLELLRDFNSVFKPEFYVSAGDRDEFGFQEGAELFSTMARNAGLRSTWVPVPGGHCSFDLATTVEFLREGAR